MTAPLRILHLEDDPTDAELVRETLETEGCVCEVTRVATEVEFLRALDEGGVDLVLADLTLPSFDGLSALSATRKTHPDLPFIFVSGTLGEDVAIEILRNGATDYVLKERLARIVPAVRRAAAEANERAERRRAETLLAGEKRLLELIARGTPLAITLDALCRLVEELSEGSLSSILLLDPDGQRLRHGAAPTLPKVYTAAIDGSRIGPVAGSCGTAAYRKEVVIVTDIARDPLWAAYRDLALPHGLRACWSTPILASDGRVLGTFAIYAREPRSPTPQERNIIEQITDLASIAIERTRAEEERQAHLAFLETMDRVNRAIQGTNDLEQMMSDVLDVVLAIFGCDRAWVCYPCDPEARSQSLQMQRTRPEFPGLFEVGEDVPMDPETADMLRDVRASKSPVRYGPGSALPLSATMATRVGVQSRMIMALYPKGERPYTFGLSQCSYARVWTAQEERLLQEIGRRMEDALTSLLMLRSLGESERKLEEAQSISHVGYWERDFTTNRYTWSNEAYRIFGLPPQARVFSFDDMEEIVHPADRELRAGAVSEALRGGRRYDVEYRAVRPSGEVVFIRSQGDVARDEEGSPRRMFGTVQDITERKRAEQRLVAHHAVTQLLTESATVSEATPRILQAVCESLDWDVGALWRMDREAGLLRCVDMWSRPSVAAPGFEAMSRALTFARGRGLPGRVWSSGAPAHIPDVVGDANFLRAPLAAQEGLHAAFGFPIVFGEDVLGVMEFFSREVRQPDQDLLDMMATIGSQIGQFIERKRAEAALRVSEASLAEGQRISHTGSWRWNPRTGELHESAEHVRIYGFDASTGPRSHLDVREHLHPDDRATIERIIDAAVRERGAFDCEGRIVRPDGVIKYLHVVGRPATDASGQLEYVGTVQDITDRKQAERRIAVQSTVAQALGEAASLEEAAPRIVRALCECLEWDVGALWRVDRSTELMRCVDVWHQPGLDVSDFEATTRALAAKPGVGMAGRVWVARGPVHVPDISKDPYVEPGPARLPTLTLRAGLYSRCGFPILLRDEVLGAMSFYSREIREPDPELLDVMASVGIQIGQFIERKHAEEALRETQAELARAARLTTMGELTASIAHEINQPLGAVVNNASACLRWLAAQNFEEARRSLGMVITDGHRAAAIIGRIRALAQKAPPQKDWLDLNDTIRDVIALARGELQAHRVLSRTQLTGDLPLVLGDRIQLQQVLLNLIMNAIEAMSGAGEGPSELVVSSARDGAKDVLVAVRDSGPGLPPQSLDRLFEAFYTTKIHGLGLGLAISRRIIETHGGRLWASAHASRGAVFRFTLPVGEAGET